jgi:hypothetical protein
MQDITDNNPTEDVYAPGRRKYPAEITYRQILASRSY